MTGAPRVRYARNGEVNIAYTVSGEGPFDLVFAPGWFSHQDLFWEIPQSRAFFESLGRFARVIAYDKRGTGMSDPLDRAGAYTDRIDDLRVVMDATGAERPHVVGMSEGGILALYFAAAEPERVASLTVLCTPIPQQVPDSARWRPEVQRGWGEGALFELFLPELPESRSSKDLWARVQRMSSSRGLALQYFDQITRIDPLPALPAISVPTQVLWGTRDLVATGDMARQLAEGIDGARLLELPTGHIPWITGSEEVVAAIEEFVTGVPSAAPAKRRLATVLFTDIVDSTARAAASGDREWRSLLDRHDELFRGHLERHGGREVKATGDGFLAAFDGPAEAIECALSARDATAELGVPTRAGIHTGQCEVRGDDLAGIAVHIGARVASLAGPGEVLVSRTVRDLVAGSDVSLEDRGEHTLKGVPEPWRVYAVT